MQKLFGSFRKKTITVSLAGAEIPVFLLDDSQVVLKITPATTAAAMMLTIKQQLGFTQDAYYSICEGENGWLRVIEDSSSVAKIITKWPQETPQGPKRLYLRRTLYMPKSPTEQEELASTSLTSGAHYMAFMDAAHHYTHGMYRFAPPAVAGLTAMLLAAYRGSYKSGRDSIETIKGFLYDVVPLYSVKQPEGSATAPGTPGALNASSSSSSSSSSTSSKTGGGAAASTAAKDATTASAAPSASASASGGVLCPPDKLLKVPPKDCTRYHDVKIAPSALTPDEMAGKIQACYKELGSISMLQAQKMFIKACKDCSVFGFEFFPGKRTFKDVAAGSGATADGSASPKTPTVSASASAGDASAKMEDVIVAVGHSGIALLPADDPTRVDLYPFERIGKWTVSRDGKIFAFSLEDARIIYVMTEVAGYMERAVEKNVEELVRNRTNRVPEEMWAQPRTTATPGVSGIGSFLEQIPGPIPTYALSAAEIAVVTPVGGSGTGEVGASSGAAASTPAGTGTPAKSIASGGIGAAAGASGGAGASSTATPSTPTGKATGGSSMFGPPSGSSPASAVKSSTASAAGSSAGVSSSTTPSKSSGSSASATTGTPSASGAKMEALPPGWRAVTDEEGDVYYWNETTDETSWDPPNPDGTVGGSGRSTPSDGKHRTTSMSSTGSALPRGWQSATDPETGQVYYFHEKTGQTSWTRPAGDGAESIGMGGAGGTGGRKTKKQLEEGLPAGWSVEFDDEGDAFYLKVETGQTSWTRPNPDGSLPKA